jgi:hypothetical protein
VGLRRRRRRRPVSGKRRQHKGGFATKKEAESALREMLGTVEAGTYVSTTGVTVGSTSPSGSRTCAPGPGDHLARLQQLGEAPHQADRCREAAGAHPLQVESCYARILKEGGKNGGPLSPNGQACHVVLHGP